MELSKYVFVTDSYNGEYKILFNSKNGFFIKYPNSDFKDTNDFISNKKIIFQNWKWNWRNKDDS